jgi:hypothetical protein
MLSEIVRAILQVPIMRRMGKMRNKMKKIQNWGSSEKGTNQAG